MTWGKTETILGFLSLKWASANLFFGLVPCFLIFVRPRRSQKVGNDNLKHRTKQANLQGSHLIIVRLLLTWRCRFFTVAGWSVSRCLAKLHETKSNHGFLMYTVNIQNKPMCYPQQLFKLLECFCTGTLRNFVCYVYRNLPEPYLLSAPQPSEPHEFSGPEPSGTSSAICTRTRRNRVCYLHRNHSEPSGTLSAIYTGTIRNLISHLHRNRPEPHQLSAPEPSGTSSAFCTGTLRNLPRNLGLQLHRIAPKLFWAKDPIASFAVGEQS